jgi:hypothetical protein
MKHVLLLATHWPEPASSAAGLRTLQLMRVFLDAEWRITFMTAAERRPYSEELPEEVDVLPLQLNSSAMDPVFEQLQPDLVWFDRFMMEEQYGWRIRQMCPNAKCMLDTVDLHSLRENRHRALNENRDFEPRDWFSELALREIAAMYRCDLNVMISEAEIEILCGQISFPESLLHYTPFLLAKEEQRMVSASASFEQRRDFVTLGNMRHPPNADSIRYLYNDLWPEIRRQCPQACMLVYGADATPSIQQLHQPQRGFRIEGRADDALEVLSRARVLLAPLRFGAGLKGKLLDAMRSGTPSVTTSIGAEGMHGDYAWPGVIAEDPADCISVAVDLYTNAEAWKNAQNKIEALMTGRFDREGHTSLFMERIERLLHEPCVVPKDHLIGALLRHHQHRSNEYMSRWIEAKNMAKPEG